MRSRAAMVGLVVATLLAVGVPAERAAVASDAAIADASVPTGRIAFSVSHGGFDGGELWTIERDGSNPHALTTGWRDVDPYFSPTGRQIAFVRLDGGIVPGDAFGRDIKVYVMNSDGSGVRQLSHNAMVATTSIYGWSADGQEVYTVGRTWTDSFSDSSRPVRARHRWGRTARRSHRLRQAVRRVHQRLPVRPVAQPVRRQGLGGGQGDHVVVSPDLAGQHVRHELGRR